MHKTPKRIYEELNRERPFCERKEIFKDHECIGRSTMEHTWIHGGRQINEKWAIIRLCEWAHSVGKCQSGGGLNKEINEFISINHATDDDFKKYPNKNWQQIKSYLNKKYDKT